MWSHVPSAPRSLLRQAAPAYLPALTLPGFSLPITGRQCPWPVEGLPPHGDRQGEHRALGEQAHGVQALKLMTTAVSSSFPNKFPLPTWHDTTCALPQADPGYPHSGLQGPESAAVHHSGSRERHENGVSQPSPLQRQLRADSRT